MRRWGPPEIVARLILNPDAVPPVPADHAQFSVTLCGGCADAAIAAKRRMQISLIYLFDLHSAPIRTAPTIVPKRNIRKWFMSTSQIPARDTWCRQGLIPSRAG